MERFCGILQPWIKSRRFPFANLDNHVVAMAQISHIKIRYSLHEKLSRKPSSEANPLHSAPPQAPYTSTPHLNVISSTTLTPSFSEDRSDRLKLGSQGNSNDSKFKQLKCFLKNDSTTTSSTLLDSSTNQSTLGNTTGNPGVSRANPYPYPLNPYPRSCG